MSLISSKLDASHTMEIGISQKSLYFLLRYIEGPNIYDGYFINVTGPAVPANQNCDDGCLFNLDFDPSERNNLIDENPEMVYRLRMELNEAKLEVNG